MKVKCIDPGDIENLQKDKIYEVKTLDVGLITLLDIKARAQYSHKRFNLLYNDKEIYLKDFVDIYKNKVCNKSSNNSNINDINLIFKNKKVRYNYKENSYLISYKDKLCDLNEIFIIFSIFRNKYGHTEYKLKSLSKKDIWLYVNHNQIHTNFYNIDKDDAINTLRRNKILKIKDKI